MGLNDNSKVREYINTVLSFIKLREIHNDISQELEGHILDIAEGLLNDGASESDAVDSALIHMGNPSELGRSLNKIHKPKPDWQTVLITLVLSGIGLFSLYSIQLNSDKFIIPNGIFTRSVVNSILGLAAAIGVYFFDYRKIKKYSLHIFGFTLVLMLYVLLYGGHVNGVRSTLAVGPLQINIVYFSPILLGISLPGVLEFINLKKTRDLLLGSTILVFPALIMIAYPSIYSALLYMVIFITIGYKKGLRKIYVAGSGMISVLLLGSIIFSNPYRFSRFIIFLDPSRDPLGYGYITMQIRNLMQAAGLWGNGFEIGKHVLPSVHTDLIFTYIVYTFGWIFGVILAALIAFFLYRMLRISGIVKDIYGRLLIVCISTILAMEFTYNMLMSIGFAPLTGFGLPLISYGGTHSIVNMALIGLISSIYRRRNLEGINVSKAQ